MRSLIVLLLVLACYPACADDEAPDEDYQPLFQRVPIENTKARVVFPLGK